MRKFLFTICSFFCLLGMLGSAQASVLTFDALGTENSAKIPALYGGFTWTNTGYSNGKDFSPGSGYDNGSVSGDYVAFNWRANEATITGPLFDFNGAHLTAAWNNGLNIEVKGFNNVDGPLYSRTVVVNQDQPTWFDFNFLGIDTLTFRSFGGIDANRRDGGAGVHFAMDNFTFNNPVPVPAPIFLLGSGLIGLAGVRRKLKK